MKQPALRPTATLACAVAAAFLGAGSALLGICGPFTDVAADVFCPFVLEIFYLGITTGTTPTTYDPTSNVSRLQMAAFLSRTVDGVLKRGSRRAALDQFWTTQNATVVGLTTVGGSPQYPASDGADIWVPTISLGAVKRVRASDGKLLETWTGADGAEAVLVAMGRVLVTAHIVPASLYSIDPSQPAGAVTIVASNLVRSAVGIAFDGSRVWTANQGGAVLIITPGPTIPWTVTTVTTGFTSPQGAVYDGSNIWITDFGGSSVKKLDANGAILQTISIGQPVAPAFDGSNIWVPSQSSQVMVIRPSTGAILQVLTGNGLAGSGAVAFDGQRILIANGSATTVSLFKAADLTPLGSFDVGGEPIGACSDGVNFWITLVSSALARF